jgi:hypothetical protein
MSAHSQELSERKGPEERAGGSRRLLALLAAVVAVGLGAGFAIGSLVKGGGGAHRSPAGLTPGVSTAGEPIPVVPALRAVAVPPSLRSKPKPHPKVASSTTGSSMSSAPSSAVTSAPASTPAATPSSSPAPSEPSTPAPASSAPKQTAPSHSGGGEVHHESGGGA